MNHNSLVVAHANPRILSPTNAGRVPLEPTFQVYSTLTSSISVSGQLPIGSILVWFRVEHVWFVADCRNMIHLSKAKTYMIPN